MEKEINRNTNSVHRSVFRNQERKDEEEGIREKMSLDIRSLSASILLPHLQNPYFVYRFHPQPISPFFLSFFLSFFLYGTLFFSRGHRLRARSSPRWRT